ncbi:RNA polymerase factor sigma-54 [Alcaligenaceae bacterium CGII-47]|nr:RNA polymerase factor sigma-54 [Alcaligenaceae bacterium CGII-47]
MPGLSHKTQIQQTTGLTPRLQQAVKLLQMSALDCEHEVTQALMSNPFLEDPTDTEDFNSVSTHGADPSNHPGTPTDVPETPLINNDMPSVTFTEYESALLPPSYSGDYPVTDRRGQDEGFNDVGAWAHNEPSLQDSLRANLCGAHLSPREAQLLDLIIDALDEDGYLRTPFSDLTNDQQLDPNPHNREWLHALRQVQQLGAPGVGARDLAECLTLQLAAQANNVPGRELAMRIVAQALEHLARCDYAGLARLMVCTDVELKEACALIRGLDPRPAARFIPLDPGSYIVPDVLVRRIDKRWVALPSLAATPRVRLNQAYAQLFRESRYQDLSLMSKALQEAQWLLRSLEQRTTTIQRVAQAIVARQQTFFDYGPIALRPLMLSEIAEELSLHESTISRATSYKYLSSPLGVFEFKHFFSRELATKSGGTCSATAVRALIREMIDEENPQQPLSDVELANRLAQDGVKVARRTVSKYRAQIKVPAAELRRAMA